MWRFMDNDATIEYYNDDQMYFQSFVKSLYNVQRMRINDDKPRRRKRIKQFMEKLLLRHLIDKTRTKFTHRYISHERHGDCSCFADV